MAHPLLDMDDDTLRNILAYVEARGLVCLERVCTRFGRAAGASRLSLPKAEALRHVAFSRAKSSRQ